ncbi:MAG TPA: gliding motility-associated C-terminal domain-containing protein [Bacteroidia bacterium]|nr:gliding motility-associated C-terminal domain-containing protein [Bacteroidia bacterium]
MSLKNLYIFIFIAISWQANAQQGFTISVKTYETCFFNSVKIKVTGNTPPYKLSWSNGLTGDTATNIVIGGDFSVHISDNDTTTRDTSLSFSLVDPPCKVNFSNHFTPNSDGINDSWGISNTIYYPEFLLQVFDRSGQLVHTQRHEYFPWEGTQLGIKLSEATYYYIFFYDEKVKSRFEKGSVTIVR